MRKIAFQVLSSTKFSLEACPFGTRISVSHLPHYELRVCPREDQADLTHAISPISLKLSQMIKVIKSVSMRKPGRTRQEVIQLKSPISLKLGTNVGFGE